MTPAAWKGRFVVLEGIDGSGTTTQAALAARNLRSEGLSVWETREPSDGPIGTLIREALKHIPAERLIISSDCGMGREGMGRRHAAYKMVAMVLGTNIVRKELGLPEAECLAAEQRYSLTETK